MIPLLLLLLLVHLLGLMITFEDFAKLEIKIGTIVEAEKVENADRLLKLTFDFGDEKRIIVSGIAEWYEPKELVGKQLPVIVNLEPRNFKGIESQGMILAADSEGTAVLIHPDKQILNGSKIK